MIRSASLKRSGALEFAPRIRNDEGSRDNLMMHSTFPTSAVDNASAESSAFARTVASCRFRHLISAFVMLFLTLGCGEYGGSDTDTSILASSVGGGLPQGLSVTEQVTSFESTVYPVLRANCVNCHGGSGPGAPQIAHPDSATAWSATVDNQKVNFSDPAASRLVRRLAADSPLLLDRLCQ